MRKIILAAVMSLFAAGAAQAECTLESQAPVVPNGAEASEAEMSATMNGIKAFQGHLGSYRNCLNAKIDNEELSVEERQAALDAFNASVDAEEKIAADWGREVKAFKAK